MRTEMNECAHSTRCSGEHSQRSRDAGCACGLQSRLPQVRCQIGSERDVLLHSSSNVLLREDQRIDLLISHSWDHTFNADVILIAADGSSQLEIPITKTLFQCQNCAMVGFTSFYSLCAVAERVRVFQ